MPSMIHSLPLRRLVFVHRSASIRYKNKVHSSTGFTFNGTHVKPNSPHLIVENNGPPAGRHRTPRDNWLRRVVQHLGSVRKKLYKPQQRDNRNFDKPLRSRKNDLEVGRYVFLHIEKTSENPNGRHKIIPMNVGPLIISRFNNKTIMIERADGTRQ